MTISQMNKEYVLEDETYDNLKTQLPCFVEICYLHTQCLQNKARFCQQSQLTLFSESNGEFWPTVYSLENFYF